MHASIPVAALLMGLPTAASALTTMYLRDPAPHIPGSAPPANCTSGLGFGYESPINTAVTSVDNDEIPPLEHAILCANFTSIADAPMAADDVVIIAECIDPSADGTPDEFCDYLFGGGEELKYPDGDASLTHTRRLIGRAVGGTPRIIASDVNQTDPVLNIRGRGWTISGFDIDGQQRRVPIEISGKDSATPARDIVIEQNRIHDARGKCIGMLDTTDGTDEAFFTGRAQANIVIRNNRIERCLQGDLQDLPGEGVRFVINDVKEPHCIHAHRVDDLVVEAN